LNFILSFLSSAIRHAVNDRAQTMCLKENIVMCCITVHK
jgi:hypothetical protein